MTSFLQARLIAGGLKSYLPIRKTYTGTGGSDSARYCFAVWLRHLMVIANAVPGLRPRLIAELGPGDSLGLGLAALLSGVERYVALDVLAHTNVEVNLGILDALAAYFRQRVDIPDDSEFPNLYPRFSQQAFPSQSLERMGLVPDSSEGRVAALRDAVRGSAGPDSDRLPIRYLCPWPTASVKPGSLDLVVSQAVLQDMDHSPKHDILGTAFAAMHRWLKPGGVMSHQVNLAFPETDNWNDHWRYGDLTWRIIRGRRPYYINRVPASEYLRLCRENDLDLVSVTPVLADHRAPVAQLPSRFRDLPATDYITRALHFIAVKR